MPRSRYRPRDQETAGQEDCGIDRAYDDVGMARGFREAVRIAGAIGEIKKDKAAEEQNFRRQEHPHPEIAQRLLLLQVDVNCGADALGILRLRVSGV